jgi:hypothetical protein
MTEGVILGGIARAGRIGGVRAPRPRVGMMVRRRCGAPAGMSRVTVVVTVMMTVTMTILGIPVSIARPVRGRGSLDHRRSGADSRERRATLRRDCAGVWLILSQWCLSAVGYD